jgi:ferredoxin
MPHGDTEETRLDILERKIGDITIRIDRTLCVGFGDCIEQAPGVFEFDDQGIVRFRDIIAGVDRSVLLLACDICPVDALAALDEAGNILVP